MTQPAYKYGATLGATTAQIDTGLRDHMMGVYRNMSVGLLISALTAWAIGTQPALMQAIFGSWLAFVVMLAPLALLLGMTFMIEKISAAAAQLLYYVFTVLMGVSLATIFVKYTDTSIVTTFLTCAGAFAGLSIYGYTTKKDLSGMGTFLVMGLIGLILAMILNIFIGSSALSFAISVIGLLIFAGFTAYDTQEIKNTYLTHAHAGDGEWLQKSAILGALNLYLDFINMFQFLLSLMGERE